MSEPDDGWRALVGRTVELWLEGRLVRTAEVEDVSADSSLMWLCFNGNDGRQIIARWEGYELRVLE